MYSSILHSYHSSGSIEVEPPVLVVSPDIGENNTVTFVVQAFDINEVCFLVYLVQSFIQLFLIS